MTRYRLAVMGKEEVAEKTMAFRLSRPDGFTFEPGQYVKVFLGGDKHTFSIASAPHENFLMFATRMRSESSFKMGLAELKEGGIIEIEGPNGSFVLPREEELPVVFLAGGIGVTPVRSMIKHMEYKNSGRPVTLFYSNRKPEDAAFLHELTAVSLANYLLVPTTTNAQESKEGWNGETGYVNEAMLRRHAGDLSRQIFYAVGPPGFVDGMVGLLHSMEDVPSVHVKSEDFTGY